MKIAIVSLNYKKIKNLTEEIIDKIKDAEIALYLFNEELTEKLPKNVKIACDCYKCLNNADIIVNTINGVSKDYSSITLENVKEFDVNKAQLLINALNTLTAINALDQLADSYINSKSNALLLNLGNETDFVTLYLKMKYGIESYGIVENTDTIMNKLLEDTQTDFDTKTIRYRMAGIKDCIWIYDIKDKSNKDIYPVFRNVSSKENLNIKRYELLLNPLKSLKFYGFYHSTNTKQNDNICQLINTISALNKDEQYQTYLLKNNREEISGINEIPMVIPCEISYKKIKSKKAELPLQCILAMNDYAGALEVLVKALTKRSFALFSRAIKLEPYIASLLTLEEADNLIEQIINFDEEISSIIRREQK